MICVMLFSVIIELSGQPASYWHHPESAIRGDGLSVNNETNHTFDFFLDRGWQPYLIANLIYISGAFLLVSLLPKKASLITIFSFIFGHYFGTSNWLAIRWHLGVEGPNIYCSVLGLLIVLSAFPTPCPNMDKIIKRLRWVMLGAMLSDTINTLIGQPISYWLSPETVHESNSLSRFFLIQGWPVYFLWNMILFAGVFWLVSILPRIWALICIFSNILGSFNGASCWFFFEWRLGMETPVIFGILLCIILVLIAFPTTSEKTSGIGFLYNESSA